MSKILVEVFVPADDRRCDLLIPLEVRFVEVTELVKAVFADDAGSAFTPSDDTILCDAVTGAIYNVNLTAEQLGMMNGSRLMLV